jgi:starvation-inducible DNA-binding protein
MSKRITLNNHLKGGFMHSTKNDLALPKRKQLIEKLNQLLADSIDLNLQVKQAHWNVKGANFIALHELFDAISAEVVLDYDMIAERVVQLGGQALGTVRVVAKDSRLKEYPLNASDEADHVEALGSALAAFNKHARKAIDETDALGDAVTADMLTGIVRGLDKQIWFVESHGERLASTVALRARTS